MMATMTDNVSHPAHYTYGRSEVIDIIRDATDGLPGFEGYLLGNALKYLLRCYHKNPSPTEDLLKARQYIDMLVTVIGEGEE